VAAIGNATRVAANRRDDVQAATIPVGSKDDLTAVGENDGSTSSAASVVRRTGSPPANCCTQMSRLPPARSHA
jgi:hypothetical protein